MAHNRVVSTHTEVLINVPQNKIEFNNPLTHRTFHLNLPGV